MSFGRKVKRYDSELRQSVVELVRGGKKISVLSRKYRIPSPTIATWVSRYSSKLPIVTDANSESVMKTAEVAILSRRPKRKESSPIDAAIAQIDSKINELTSVRKTLLGLKGSF
jgi:transposase-like protein